MPQKRTIFRTSNSFVSFEESKFKDDIVKKLGGEDQFQFVVISFCERIRNDGLLKKCYKSLDEKGLIELHRDMILTCFLDVSPSEYQTLRSKLMLRYHLIFQECMREPHFEALERNFVNAMRDCWVDEPVLEQCKGYFGTMRSVLKDTSSLNRSLQVQNDVYVNRAVYRIVRA